MEIDMGVSTIEIKKRVIWNIYGQKTSKVCIILFLSPGYLIKGWFVYIDSVYACLPKTKLVKWTKSIE